MGDRLRQEPVGKPRVAGQERTVEVRPDRAADTTALIAARAVVAEPGHDAAERLGALVEDRPAGVVLEARERLPPAGLQLALEEHVPDHAPRACDRVEREQADARLLCAALVAVEATEQLIATADGEEGGAVLERLTERRRQGGQR